MNKALRKGDFSKRLARRMGVPQSQGAAAVDAFTDCVLEALEEYDRIILTGFGTFSVNNIKARKIKPIRGDHAGEIREVPAHKRLAFSAGADAKKALAKLD